MKNCLILYFLLFGPISITSAQIQDAKELQRRVLLPDIPGYKTLKCDFHMHTVFSDGHVWPTFRVFEALRDDLDAISLTEHTDYEGSPDDIKKDLNRSYDLASEYAEGKNILIIKGAEISPRVPPYHNNALFLKDSNLPFDYMKISKKQFIMKDNPTHADLLAPFLAAQKQDAFVVYNHPGNMPAWVVHDTAVFTNFHKELLQKNILKGIEVVNSGIYNVTAHRLAMKYNLTMLCNTDEHNDMYPRYAKTHRPMTLVFAKEKTEAGIKEALLARRTALYFDDYLIARQVEAESFFKAAIKVKAERRKLRDEPILVVKLFNDSDIPFKLQTSGPFTLETYSLGQIILAPHKETELTIRAMWQYPKQINFKINVMNILISPDESLKTSFIVSTEN
ncbi:Sb-PDE family phosphodiesterase [Pedobacter heparinus]|uniref:Sb-PDE family phosphodiesterase n=1 Tax=Pedobacter heparinus TaxID=984 RepID=UPI0029309846|nr:Sb-PDE family phosphodiesterase [Pedobacter heparinus]